MKTALICVDNLRVGGFQRLALDEAYLLSDQGFRVLITSLESPETNLRGLRYFSDIEDQLIGDKGIEIKYISPQYLSLVISVRSVLGSLSSLDLVISHSLRTTFALRINQIRLVNFNYVINTKIHQIPSLVDRRQRFKRLVFALFTNNLFGFSEAVSRTWNSQLRWFGRLPKMKKLRLLRNGIYLPRLPNIEKRNPVKRRPQLIFLGRLTFWKGVGVIQRLASVNELAGFDFLFVVPNDDERYLGPLREILADRLQVIVGKSVASLSLQMGDVHLYPTQYGDSSLITESVSLNCLEMASLGIPSLVTRGGQLTWNENVFKEIFLEVDWENTNEVSKKIISASCRRITDSDIDEARTYIDISNEIQGYYQESNNSLF